MELTEAQYARIAPCLPVQRGNVRLSNLQVAYYARLTGLSPRGSQLAHRTPG